MKSTRVLLSMALALTMVLGFTSCKKAVPVSKFSFTASVKTVTFVNESTDALTYLWDFGDNTTSTEQSPVHTYSDFGLYSISLKATGDGGENTATADIELVFTPSMEMDGNFAKWNTIPTFVEGAGGTMTKVKLSHDDKYLYIYVEGSETFRGFMDVYIDGDNDGETGAKTWIYPMGAGADYLLEGFLAESGDADLFLDDPATTDWAWTNVVPIGSGLVKSSALKTITGGKAIEFSIMRELAPKLGSTIHIGFVDVAEDWSMQGGLPLIGGEASALLEYKLQ